MTPNCILVLAHVAFLIILISDVNGNKSDKVDSNLQAILDKGETANVVIRFKDGIQSALQAAKAAQLSRGGDRGSKNKAILDALAENADKSQQGVLRLLSAKNSGDGFSRWKQYKSTNVLYIRDANAALVQLIAEDEQVAKIKKEPVIRIPDSEIEKVDNDMDNGTSTTTKRPQIPNWGIYKMEVYEAWEELGGIKGDGVLVGTIDSGVKHTHVFLRDNFAGIEYGWLDAIDKKPEPYAASDHGTATTGIIVANDTMFNGIGVAPKAKWMTCLACNETTCPFEALRDCIQFMECPTLPDGSNPDCSKAPHIVSNSWVTAHGDEEFKDDVMRWRELGIIPVFAIGNDGTECATSAAPGEFPFVIGVGSAWGDGTLYRSSSIGPAPDGTIKPDLVAPGANIVSACGDCSSDYEFRRISGTSAACPQVAGVIALLLARNLTMTFDDVYKLLTENAVRDGHNNPERPIKCNDTAGLEGIYPNNLFGFGYANALNSVKAQSALLKMQKR